jgi:hypothetical protein
MEQLVVEHLRSARECDANIAHRQPCQIEHQHRHRCADNRRSQVRFFEDERDEQQRWQRGAGGRSRLALMSTSVTMRPPRRWDTKFVMGRPEPPPHPGGELDFMFGRRAKERKIMITQPFVF